MGKKSKNALEDMNLQEILEKTDAIFNPKDILNFCEDKEVIADFVTLYQTDLKEIEKLLVDNADKIKKEKLVFNLYLNYVDNIATIKADAEQLAYNIVNELNNDPQIIKKFGGKIKIKSFEDFKRFINANNELLIIALKFMKDKKLSNRILDELEEIADYEKEKYEEEIHKKNCRNLLKGTDVYLEKIRMGNRNHLEMTIYSSKEVVDGISRSSKKEIERLNKIDREVGDDGKGLTCILQCLSLADLEQIIPDSRLGIKLREIILINALAKNGPRSVKDIYDLKNKNYEEYEELLKTAPIKTCLEELRSEIIKNARYIDIDKLLLICVYRYEEYIEENPDLNYNNYIDFREIIYYIMGKIKNTQIEFEGDMVGNSNEEKHVKYTYKDAEKFIVRLTDDRYVSKGQINQYRVDLLSGKIKISDIEPEVLQLLDLSNEEYDEVTNNNDENIISIIEIAKLSENAVFLLLNEKKNISKDLFTYVIENEKISIETALELYYNGKFSAEYFDELIYNEKFMDLIDIKLINDEYMSLKLQSKSEEKDLKRLDSKIELFKHVYIDKKHEKEQQEAYNRVMDEIAETFEDENDVLYYYGKGLISFEIVAEWCGEKTIKKIYNEAKNDEEKEVLKAKLIDLSKKGIIKNELLEQILLVDKATYDELMALILQGAISESKIVDLYMQGRIFDVDFEEMLNNGIISHEEFFTATELRTQEKLEETSSIKLSPILKNIPDKKNIIIDTLSDKEDDDDWYKPDQNNRRKTLIHPAVRYEYLEKLGAKKADVLDIDEENAFYNYEFFVIPDKNGELSLNSVVIAERFYKDKDTQEEYALDNATYFFQYKDLMVNSNLSKQEMTKERDRIVFRANHRSGSWAIRVLYNIAKTMASSNFKDIKNKDAKAHRALDELDKIYSHEELMSILDLAGEIDDKEKYTYELIDDSMGVKKSNDTNDDNDEIPIIM